MLFSLDVRRARKGDCLLLHYGSEDDPHLILIDGGPSDVYEPHLKPRIIEIHEGREIEEGDPLPVDVVMVSHVDDDHIKGILDLTKEQRKTTPDLRLHVASLWHNSFDDLLTTRPKELKEEAGFGAASLGAADDGDGEAFDPGSILAGFDAAALQGEVEVESEDEFQTVQVLASIPQGRQLRNDAKALGWKPNRSFRGELIIAGDGSKPVTLKGGLTVTVAGPMQPELLALQEAHDKWLREQKKNKNKKKAAEAALAAYVDRSAANLSSIVVLAEVDGKRMLLTGDARGDKILEGLEMVGLLKKGGKMEVDVLKVPHHGSANNLETGFRRIIAQHYVFSGNGEHGNPEREGFEMLFEARGNEPFVVHLTYPTHEIDAEREKDWEKEQAKEKKRRDKKKTKAEKDKVKVRPDWSPEEHSLAAFFKERGLASGQKIEIVPEKKAHLIELLDPLGF